MELTQKTGQDVTEEEGEGGGEVDLNLQCIPASQEKLPRSCQRACNFAITVI